MQYYPKDDDFYAKFCWVSKIGSTYEILRKDTENFNAIATVNGNEIVDVISEDDKTKEEIVSDEEVKEVKETKKTTKAKKEVVEEVKEEVKEEKVEKEDLSSKNLTELKEIAKERGIKGYSKLKKEELLEVLK